MRNHEVEGTFTGVPLRKPFQEAGGAWGSPGLVGSLHIQPAPRVPVSVGGYGS